MDARVFYGLRGVNDASDSASGGHPCTCNTPAGTVTHAGTLSPAAWLAIGAALALLVVYLTRSRPARAARDEGDDE